MKKSETIFVFVFVILFVGLFFTSCLKKSVTQNKSKKYNVILIVSDALRRDVLGCYGGELQTPNIDWLANNGALFKNAYSNSTVTQPVAVCLFTGNYSLSYGAVTDEKRGEQSKAPPYVLYVPNREQLIGDALKEIGYSKSAGLK